MQPTREGVTFALFLLTLSAVSILLNGCDGAELPDFVQTSESEPLEIHRTRVDAEGSRAEAACPPKTVLIGGGCVCNLGQLYESGWGVQDNTGIKVWECGCNPLPDYPYSEPPFTLATQAQAICMGPTP